MKKIITFVGITFVLSGCNQSKDSWLLNSSMTIKGSEKAAEFIVNCASAANPLSDEEGEDLVVQCEYTAKSIYGVEEFYAWNKDTWKKTCYFSTHKEAYNCMKNRGLVNEGL